VKGEDGGRGSNNLASGEDGAIRNKYQEWRTLSPKERQKLEKEFDRWDSLSPQERD